MTDLNADWYSEDSSTFGDRLAGAREAQGMSQSDLSKRLGVKLKTIKAWENDLSEPRSNKLMALSGILNVSMMWLLTGEGEGLDGPAEAVVISPDVKDALTDIRELKMELKRNADRLGLLEKKLRTALRSEYET